MTDDTLTTQLLDMAKARFGERANSLSARDDLYEALGIDSMEAMDLLTDLEEAFDVEIPDYALAEVRTIASIATLIKDLT